jgi:hypothetical protein
MKRSTAISASIGALAVSAALSKSADAAPAMLNINGTSVPVQSVTDLASLNALAQSPAFCNGWQAARPVLQAFASAFTAAPWSFLYQGVIAVIIGIGDKVACPAAPATPPTPAPAVSPSTIPGQMK